jgi:hypothetical protein
VDPMRISFTHAVRAILIFSPALACERVLRLPAIYRALISEIAHHLVPERPGRIEPRAVRREHKHYPLSKKPVPSGVNAMRLKEPPFGTASRIRLVQCGAP